MKNKKEIQQLYSKGLSISELSRRFNCSRRLINFILNPDKYEKQKQVIKDYYKNNKINQNTIINSKLKRLTLLENKQAKLYADIKNISVQIQGIKNFLETKNISRA